MKRISLFTLLCGAFFLASSCYGSDVESAPITEEKPICNKPRQNKDEDHIEVGTRRMAHAEHAAVQEQRAAEKEAQAEGEQGTAAELIESKEACATAKDIKQAKAGYYNYTTHAGAYHNPLVVGILDNTITLEDGSIWLVSADDAYKTWNWLISDLIVITPHHWCSIYDYVITNQNTGVSVKVNLFAGPLVYSIFRRSIVLIDYLMDQVWLDDGTVWSMTDCTIMRNWAVGDTVIIGVNDGVFSTHYPNILINVNMLNYGRGICLY